MESGAMSYKPIILYRRVTNAIVRWTELEESNPMKRNNAPHSISENLKDRNSNNGDTLAELERKQQEIDEKINAYGEEVRFLRTRLTSEEELLNRAFMEKTNVWTRIRCWKQEMGVKP